MSDGLAVRWNEWIGLLEASGFAVRELLEPPASDIELRLLEAATGLTLTDEIAAFYRLNNGQKLRPSLGMSRDGKAQPWPPHAAPPFGFYEFLSTRDAATAWTMWKSVADQQGAEGMAQMTEFVEVSEPEKVKQEYWIPGWLPFAKDGGGNSLAFDLDPEPRGTVGQIIIIGSDEDHRRVFAPLLEQFLARLIAEWQAGRYEIDLDGPDERYYDLPYLHRETS